MIYTQPEARPPMFDIIDKPYYLTWWIMSDNFSKMMNVCEKMSALVCGCSMLKGHDLKLKRSSYWSKCCSRCDLSVIKNAGHIVMQCPFYDKYRNEMYNEMELLESNDINDVMNASGEAYAILFGKPKPQIPKWK